VLLCYKNLFAAREEFVPLVIWYVGQDGILRGGW